MKVELDSGRRGIAELSGMDRTRLVAKGEVGICDGLTGSSARPPPLQSGLASYSVWLYSG